MAMAYSSQFNLDKLRQNLFAKQGRANAAMRQATKEGAERIMRKSQENSPVDTFNLEEAHHIVESITDADHVRYTVEVSGVGFGSNSPREVANYALLVHENLAPYGSGELGGKPFNLKTSKGSPNLGKLAAGYDVGGMFLERAIESEKPYVIQNIKVSVRKAVRK